MNHLFSALTGARALADLRLPLGRLPLIETLNGSMPEPHNEHARRVGRAAGMAPVGGSDSHTLAGVGRAYTTVAGARSKAEFLEGLRRGLTVPSGRSGSYARLSAEVARVFAAAYRDAAREAWAGIQARPFVVSLALLPLLPAMPIVTAWIYAHETRFGNRHFRAFQQAFGWPPERTAATNSLAARGLVSPARGLASPARSLGQA